MRITGLWLGVIALVFGILVIVVPALLNWLVGIYLIVVGILAITGKK